MNERIFRKLKMLIYIFFCVVDQHQCVFCQQRFSSAILKDDHILEHFVQEKCTDCNQNLIRIGSKLYTIHDAVTCVNRDSICDTAVTTIKTEKIKRQLKPIKLSKADSENTKAVEFLQSNELKPDVQVVGFEEILIKLEPEDEEGEKERPAQTVSEIIEVDVDIEDENQLTYHDPEYIIIDFNDIPLVREQPQQSDHQIPIAQVTTKQITKCDVCSQEFDCVFFLESHRKLKHPMATNPIDVSVDAYTSSTSNATPPKIPNKGTKSISKPIEKTTLSEKLECLLCNKLYKTETSLRHHIDTIHDPSARKFKCDICHAAFFREAALQNHHENQHLDMKKFWCGICNSGLKSKISLERHMFALHTKKKPYECTWNGCKKRFTCTANRDEHYRSHTGEKRFFCTVEGCNNRYSFAADIRKHLYKIHNIFPKKFPCELCTQVFPQRAMLQKHMKKHSKK